MQHLTQDMHTMQLAVEATFLEAALQVVEPAAEMLPDNQTRAVEKLAFDWILNTERYVGPQYPELHKARDKVHLSGSEFIQLTQHECKHGQASSWRGCLQYCAIQGLGFRVQGAGFIKLPTRLSLASPSVGGVSYPVMPLLILCASIRSPRALAKRDVCCLQAAIAHSNLCCM